MTNKSSREKREFNYEHRYMAMQLDRKGWRRLFTFCMLAVIPQIPRKVGLSELSRAGI